MTSNRLGTVAIVATLLLAAVAGGVGLGAAAGQTATQQSATLEIQQPHYIDQEVRTTNENGTQVYLARGERLDIQPTLLNQSDVVAFGVETDSGQLTYDSTFEHWLFEPSAAGTHTLYWVTERQVQRQEGNETVTQTQQTRHVARVRVEGGLNIDHQPASDMTETREDAQKWREFNSTLDELREGGILVDAGLADPPSTNQLIQQMVTAYLTIHDPIAVATGNYTQILTLIVLSPGGWLFLLSIFGPLVFVIVLLYKRQTIYELIEADEGDLATRMANFDAELSRQALQNKDFNDIWSDDHIAAAMRKLGETPLDAIETWYSTNRPRYALHDRLQAMAAEGYVAVADEDTRADGGAVDSEAVPASARVVHEDDVADDVETYSLEVRPDHPLLDAIQWDQFEIREFDLAGADYDRADADTAVEQYDLETLIDRTGLDMREFDSEQAAAEYLAELFRDIRRHPITDDGGTPDTMRYTMEQFLREAQLLEDRYELPVQYWAQLWERALVDYDQGAEAEKTLQQIRDGGYDD